MNGIAKKIGIIIAQWWIARPQAEGRAILALISWVTGQKITVTLKIPFGWE
jgi:hypothetical protein